MQCTFPSVYTHPKQRHSQRALLQTSRAQGEMSCEQMCERREGGWFFVHQREHTQDRAKAACRFENSVTKRGWALSDFLPLLFRRVLKWARRVAWWHSCISDMCKYVCRTEHQLQSGRDDRACYQSVGKLLHRQLLMWIFFLRCTKAASLWISAA